MRKNLADASDEWVFKTIRMADLIAPIDTQLRVEGVNEEVAQGYALIIKQLPPVDVFFDEDEGTIWLSDGHHRYRGHEIAKESKIKTRWKKGTLRDAILHAIKSNHGHGLHRSNADKRNAVRYMLRDDQWRKRSDRWIATQVGVSHDLVRKLRAELCPAQVDANANSPAEPAKREGADGKAYPARQPIPKPTGKRKKSGSKMDQEPQARGPQYDSDGNEISSGEELPAYCNLCGEIDTDGHDCALGSETPPEPAQSLAANDYRPGYEWKCSKEACGATMKDGEISCKWCGTARPVADPPPPLPGKPPPAPPSDSKPVRVPTRVDLTEVELAALHCVTEADPDVHAGLFDDWERTEGRGECVEADARGAVVKLGVRFE